MGANGAVGAELGANVCPSRELPGRTCLIAGRGKSSSSGRMKRFLCAGVMVCGRFLTSPRNSDGTMGSPLLKLAAPDENPDVGAAKLNIANHAPIKQRPIDAKMRGLKRPDWE